MKYFLDTSAIIEIIKATPKYQKYLNEEFSTTIFNLYELYYVLLKDKGEEIAEEFYNQFKQFLSKVNVKQIFKASQFKLKNKKINISYTDALGYAVSLENNLKFLTGDSAFQNFENVEFVKN